MAEMKKIQPPSHICTKNHHGSSKSMEVEDNKRVGICCIVSDDNTTMRAHLKHSWREKIMTKKMSKINGQEQ